MVYGGKGKKLSLLIKEHVVEKKLNILYLFHGQAHEGTNGQEKQVHHRHRLYYSLVGKMAPADTQNEE